MSGTKVTPSTMKEHHTLSDLKSKKAVAPKSMHIFRLEGPLGSREY